MANTNTEKKLVVKGLPEAFVNERQLMEKESQNITIDSDQEFEFYAGRSRDAAALIKKIEEYHEDTRLQAHSLWKSIVKLIDDSTAPIKETMRRYDRGLMDYRRKKQQQAEAKRIADQQAAQKQHDDLYVESANQLEKAGEHAAAALVIEQGATMTAVVTTPVEEVPKVKGITFKEDYEFELIDTAGNVVEDSPLLPRQYLIPDEKAIRKVVKALGLKACIPGVRVKVIDRMTKRSQP